MKMIIECVQNITYRSDRSTETKICHISTFFPAHLLDELPLNRAQASLLDVGV